MRKHLLLISIVVASLIVHFAYFGHPKETVFDEVHFGKFISGYFTHEYFFDIHPPLGKLLISGMGYIGGFKPGFSFAEIGEKFPDNTYLWLRFLPTLAGVLLPIIIFFLALRLGISRFGSFAAGMFIVLESSFLAQSRLILLDSFLLFFGFSALLSYFKYRQEKRPIFFLIAGILGALAVSVKWTGATFLAIIAILEIINLIKSRRTDNLFSGLAKTIIVAAVIPFLIYFSIFVIHLKLLNKSGPGDAFMTPVFQKTLIGNPNAKDNALKPLGLLSKFFELNIQMYKSNAGLTATHPYSSQWFTWPFMIRPIYYWYQADSGGLASRIYFIGNPLIWWLSTGAVIYALIVALGNIFLRFRKVELIAGVPLVFLGGYFLNLLPFIGITRAMFLYHYMVALIFAILILVFLIDRFKRKKIIFGVILSASLVLFIFFAPIIYGLPLSESAYNARAWLSSWK